MNAAGRDRNLRAGLRPTSDPPQNPSGPRLPPASDQAHDPPMRLITPPRAGAWSVRRMGRWPRGSRPCRAWRRRSRHCRLRRARDHPQSRRDARRDGDRQASAAGPARGGRSRVRARHPGRPALPRRPRAGPVRLRRRGRRLVGRRARPRRAARPLRREPADARHRGQPRRGRGALAARRRRRGRPGRGDDAEDAVHDVPEADGPAALDQAVHPRRPRRRVPARGHAGHLGAGDAVRVEHRPGHGVTVADLLAGGGPPPCAARGPRGGRRHARPEGAARRPPPDVAAARRRRRRRRA